MTINRYSNVGIFLALVSMNFYSFFLYNCAYTLYLNISLHVILAFVTNKES